MPEELNSSGIFRSGLCLAGLRGVRPKPTWPPGACTSRLPAHESPRRLPDITTARHGTCPAGLAPASQAVSFLRLSTGSLGMVPPIQRYYGTLRLPAVRLDSFDFFTSRYHRLARGLLPSVVGVPPGGRELSVPVSPSGLTMETSGKIWIDDGNVGVSQVPWKPWWSLSVLFDPGRIRQAEWTKSKLPDTAPACVHDEGSRRLVLSGLNHTTFDLTVYASQDGSPHHHARLASGCWSSFARRDSYPQGFNKRFQSSSLFLLSKAFLTQGQHT